MPLAPGTRIGPYEVVAQIGVGGMGEVYRATDTGLHRDVAIKVLPDEFAQDVERLARFEREAKTLASLSHPGIATIHGLERTDGSRALVMEFIDGPTLAERIAEGPLPVDEALAITRQIADALEVAHEQGIVHRDLKPANIKLRPDGVVKVLDFGLAKIVEPVGVVSGRSMSPTITSPAMTQAGVILGTAAYMSPEQAKGRAADKRSDVWSFGCVIYEMLVGKRAFDGEDVSDTLASILRGEPDWSALPPEVPPAIVAVLKRMLEKDRRRRVGDVAAVSFVVSEPQLLAGVSHVRAGGLSPRWIGLALLTAAALLGGGWWAATRFRGAEPEPKIVTRLVVPLRAEEQRLNPSSGAIALSPTGRHLAFVADGRLYLRALDGLESVPIRGTESNATSAGRTTRPQFSPDGEWLAFVKEGEIRKVRVSGGPVVTIGAVSFTNFSWEPDGTIVFSTDSTLSRMPEAGGAAQMLFEGVNGRIQSFQMLAERNSVLYTLMPVGTINPAATRIIVRSLQDGRETVVASGGIEARYVSTGHLVYFADGSLLTVRFDLDQLKVTGTPEPVADRVLTGAVPGIPVAAVQMSISRAGMLAYGRGDPRVSNARSLVWVDRQGREEPLAFPPQPYVYPRLSPDQRLIGVTIRQQIRNDIYVLDPARKTSRPFAADPADERYSAWTTDGKRLYFGSQRNDEPAVWWQAADGSGTPQRLIGFPRTRFSNFLPTSISPDGALAIVTATTAAGADLWTVSLSGSPEAKPLLNGPAAERSGEISPDGRWLAYEAIENGQVNVLVRPFPNVNDGLWRVSNDASSQPLWARSGQELFFLDAFNLITSVGVEPGASAFTPGVAVKVLERAYASSIPTYIGPQYDVSNDGKRFLVMKDAGISSQTDAPAIVIVQNWFEELRRR
jgi:Tol biopolymer transport system component